MSVIISGASGFLGSNLSDYLSKYIDNIYFVPGRKIENLLLDKSSNIDVNSYFVHLAEPSLTTEYSRSTSLVLTKNVKILSKKFGAKLIYVSSALVYGDQSVTPFTEESAVKIINNYTKLKLVNEQIVLNSGGIVIRLSNMIGDGMHENNVFGDIYKQLKVKKNKLIIRNLKSIRDYISVHDVCRFIKIILAAKWEKNQIYNIGSGEGISVKDIVDLMGLKMDHQFETIIETQQFDYLSCNILNITKSFRDFGWKPKATFEDIIKKFMDRL